MQRTLMKDLIAWKNSPIRKPLILRGARQTGKTWILQKFGADEFPEVVYVRLEDNVAMETLFAGSLDPQRLLEGIAAYTGKVVTSDTLLILDEIQAVPRALTALKYFYEEIPEYPIAVAGSLLGVMLGTHTSFPVGKVDFLDLYPMTFGEFLLAGGHDALLGYVQQNDFDMISVFAEQFTDLLRHYYYVGGMPEAVQHFVRTKDFRQVRTIQRSILYAYEGDFSKHTTKETAQRCRQIWNSIPAQLAKENKKFVYRDVQKGSRGRDYSAALQFLENSGLIYAVSRIAKPGIPLASYKESTGFKLFLADVGLLGAMTDLDERTIIEGNRLLEEFKGSYTEQFAAQQLITECDFQLFYWTAEKSSGEIDFIFQSEGNVYPVEVKAAENLKSKSLASFCAKFNLEAGIRLSLSGYREQKWMQNIPLYAIGGLHHLLRLK